MRLCDGAFEALMGGDSERHDRMVAMALAELAEHVELILLAQASMAPVAERLEGTLKGAPNIPVRSSPQAGLDAAFRFLAR